MKRTDNQTEQNVIKDYESGMSMSKIGKKYDMNPKIVMLILDRNGIPKRSHGGICRLPEQQIVEQYKSGKSTGVLSKEYGISVKGICDLLKRNNCPRNNKQGAFELKDNYWETIDTPDKAYFLGWMITDGSVYKDFQTRIEIKSDDEYILEVFKKYTGITAKIHLRYTKKHLSALSHITQYSKKWCHDLSKYNVIQNKIKIVCMPKIDECLMSHLLRGMFDGDGTVSQTGCFGFCGNERCVKDVYDYLHNKLNTSGTTPKQNIHGVWSTQWGKKDSKKIGQYIYQNKSDIYLKRKFERFIHANPEIIAETKESVTS